MIKQIFTNLRELFVIIILMLLTSIASAQVIEFTTERDANGAWTNWTVITATWEATTAPTGDHQTVCKQNQQDWYVEFSGSGWQHTYFNILDVVTIPNNVKELEYAIRVSGDGEWFSEPASVVIIRPKAIKG